MKKLLWVGDAGVPSGFARATHETLDVLREDYDICVLGMNYRGDPHNYPYPIYAAAPGGDAFGFGRVVWMCDMFKPDLIVLQNDPWNIPGYIKRVRRFEEHAHIPFAASIAVDGMNCKGAAMNALSMGIFWTQFGLDQARLGGYREPGTVVPLGVDLKTYYQTDRIEARHRVGLPKEMDDVFIVGNVNRNQPRKRLDLTVRYFCRWITDYNIRDAWLYLHVAPTGDYNGYDVLQLMAYYGCADRLILMEPQTFYGRSEDYMRDTYNSFNAQLTTTQGEGFGLTTFEGAACGVLQILPDWAALGELMGDVSYSVPCTSTCTTHDTINSIGGVIDEEKTIEALNSVYAYPSEFECTTKKALARVSEPRFRWRNVGEAFRDALKEVV